MARIDLHCHTCFSYDRHKIRMENGMSLALPYRPVLTPKEVYDLAMDRGMDFVTFTDHDTIQGVVHLLDEHPELERNFLTGEEVSARFSDGMVIHINIVGLTESDHKEIHRYAGVAGREHDCLRYRVPDLIAFLETRRLFYFLNHMLWTTKPELLTWERTVELVELFRTFEGRNGCRSKVTNELIVEIVRKLRGDSARFVAGSDSHADNMALTWTEVEARNKKELLSALKSGPTKIVGEHGSPERFHNEIRLVLGHNASQALDLVREHLPKIPSASGVSEFARELAEFLLAVPVAAEFRNQQMVADRMRGFLDRAERGHVRQLA